MKLNREEWSIGLVIASVLLVLNGMMILKYSSLLDPLSEDYAKQLSYLFHVSGFDPITYKVLTHWQMAYDVVRHPLLPYYMYPFYLLNQLLGSQGAMYIVAIIMTASGFFSAVFLFRILRHLVELKRIDAWLLTLFFFSFGYVLATFFVPDHFGISLCLILVSLYLIGKAQKEGRMLKLWQTILLFVATSGVTLTNGAKVYAAELIARGKHFFNWRFLLLAVVLPSMLMVGAGLLEERIYVYPKQQADKKYFEEHKAEMIAKARKNHQRYKNAPWVIHKGKPFGQGSLLQWTDSTTSRPKTLQENVFGESIQLHSEWVLDDVLTSYRPVLLSYHHWYNYASEGLIILLLLIGIIAGFNSKLLWMCILGILPDAAMHLGLGFAINEIYIMSAHWIYIIPIAIAFIFAKAKGNRLYGLRAIVVALTIYLFIHNLWLIIDWMNQPVVSTSFWYE